MNKKKYLFLGILLLLISLWGTGLREGSEAETIQELPPTAVEASATEDGGSTVYLSDIEWVSASHGDVTDSKTVQKDRPFTSGNDGQDTKISLVLADGTVQSFDKGLGTVAASPASIVYDISDALVSKFSTYIGLDRTANHQDSNHAKLDRVEIIVDDQVLYSTKTDHPDGILYDTPAIKVDLAIPEGARNLELRAYAGEQTWGDELVFAGAFFVAKGKFKNPHDFTPAEKRREITNDHPLLMMPLYANGPEFEKGNYSFWGDDTLYGKWESIPDDLKPYVVIQLHPDDLPKREGTAAQFYEYFLKKAKEYVNPKTGQNEPIPIILTTYTAGNVSHYTAAHWLTNNWIENMYRKYPNLQGLFSTENYWIWSEGIESRAADYLSLSAKYGGYFIWSEQNNHASIEKAMGTQGKTKFKDTLDKYWQNFIFMYKNTPAAEGNDAPTSSYMTGLWLSDYAYQWGGLMDTWKWYETGKWKLFAEGNIGKSQGDRQWLTEPEAMLGEEALAIYLNGGSVYNFEHPFYTYGVKDLESPLFTNVIKEFFRYVIANPAPSKEEVRNRTKVVLRGDFSTVNNGRFFEGLHTERAQSPLYTTGRYGNIAAVPSTISQEDLRERFREGVRILDLNSPELASLDAKKQFFDSIYEKQYEGDIFGQKIENRWFIYNYKYNENTAQTGTFDFNGIGTTVTLEPHSFLIGEVTDNTIQFNLNNYRTNKDSLWEGAGSADEAKNLPQLGKVGALNWVYERYIQTNPGGEARTTTIVLENVVGKPSVDVLSGTDQSYQTPEISYDSLSKKATITIKNNGYLNFKVTLPKAEGDKTPDAANTDSDSDGYTDDQEKVVGTDPKDSNSKPTVTVGNMDDKTIIEKKTIEAIEVPVTNLPTNATVEVAGLPDGLTYHLATGQITGTATVADWAKDEKERQFLVKIVVKDANGNPIAEKETPLKVQRATDDQGKIGATAPNNTNSELSGATVRTTSTAVLPKTGTATSNLGESGLIALGLVAFLAIGRVKKEKA